MQLPRRCVSLLDSIMSSKTPYETTWLDILPDDISARVAAFVTRGEITLDGLHLAEVSSEQRCAVWRTLRHPIPVRLSTLKHEIAFIRYNEQPVSGLFAEKAANIFSDYDLHVGSFEMTKWTEKLMQQSRTTHCTIGWNPALIDALSGSSIRFLNVQVGHHTDVEKLIRVLKSLDLEEMNIRGSLGCKNKIAQLVKGLNAIVAKCENLRKISLRDFSFSNGLPESLFWEQLENLAECVEVSVKLNHIPAPQELVAKKLGRLRAVHARGTWTELAYLIGSIVSFRNTRSFLNAEQITQLSRCSNLKEVSLRVPSQGCEELIDALRCWVHLRRLSLVWRRRFNGRRRVIAEGPAIGTMERLVKAASLTLTELSVDYVCTSCSEWETILEYMGARLEGLRISDTFLGKNFVHGDDTVIEVAQENYVVQMLCAVLRFNPKIKRLRLHRTASKSRRYYSNLPPILDRHARYLIERRPSLDENMLLSSMSSCYRPYEERL